MLVRATIDVRKWRRLGREADRAVDPKAELVAGETFVQGVVELVEGMDFAVVVELRQVGTET
jgi:hypothetical protein